MGYFSQKKQRNREKHFLATMAFLLGGVCVFLLFNHQLESISLFLDNWLLQLFILNSFLIIFAIYRQQGLLLSLFIVYLIIFYVVLTSHANLLVSPKIFSPKNVLIELDAKNGITEPAQNSILRSGYLNLTEENKADFYTIESYGNPITVVSIDFKGLSAKQRHEALDQLSKFVLIEEHPVVVLGNFGAPAWDENFKKFLDKTSLKVKNPVLFRDANFDKKFFVTPQINIVSFDNIGVEEISFSGNKMEVSLDIL